MEKGTVIYKTNIGYIQVVYEQNYVTELKLIDAQKEDLKEKTALTDVVYSELQEYFEGKRKTFSFLTKPQGTEFQKKVWDALCNIPYGETKSYKEIATAIGIPKACRAVGLANNKNPIPFIIPCHRVIGSNGSMVGYAYGLELKKKLLEMEGKCYCK